MHEEDRVGQFVAKEPVVKDDGSIVHLIFVQLAAAEDHALRAIPKVSGGGKSRQRYRGELEGKQRLTALKLF